MVAICSTHVNPDSFFEGIADLLRYHKKVTNFVPILEAKVPMMEFEYDSVPINLMCAQLPRMEVPVDLDILDDEVLAGIEVDSDVMSLNGPRTTELLIRAVPNYPVFVEVLRCVRLWAKRRALYSHKRGFLGGVNWAILAAFCCKLHPKGTPASILHKFFFWMKQWSWPKPLHIRSVQTELEARLGHKNWDAWTSPNDMMPILTPAFPCFNSSFNVCWSTLKTMKDEFDRGFTHANLAMKDPQYGWQRLFETSDFFIRYTCYLQISLSAADVDRHRAWSGWVEARLRKLVLLLEDYTFVTNITPHPNTFMRGCLEGEAEGSYYFIGFDVDQDQLYREPYVEAVEQKVVQEEETPKPQAPKKEIDNITTPKGDTVQKTNKDPVRVSNKIDDVLHETETDANNTTLEETATKALHPLEGEGLVHEMNWQIDCTSFIDNEESEPSLPSSLFYSFSAHHIALLILLYCIQFNIQYAHKRCHHY